MSKAVVAAIDAPAPGTGLAEGAAATPATPPLRVCAAADLVDGGRGVRFEVPGSGGPVPAFAVRQRGAVRAFVNRCAHVPGELDWTPGVFFDSEGEWLMCATHGALYDAADGRCVGGACRGHGGLQPLAVDERDGVVWWRAPGGAANT